MKTDFEFVKMHGAGNDFVLINDLKNEFDESVPLIGALCRYHTGIGSDGLILLKPSDIGQFRMRYFNRDGREAAMCGNGARCAALYAHMSRIAGRKMIFETGTEPVEAEILDTGVRIKIGQVSDYKECLELKDSGMTVGFARCGVPHATVVTEDSKGWDNAGFLELARSVRNDPVFAPDGTNFNLVSIINRNSLVYRTFERGVEEETSACGTGAVAVSVITSHMGLISSPVICETSGGDFLEVEFELNDNGAKNCYLSGPAVVTFSGHFSLSNYL